MIVKWIRCHVNEDNKEKFSTAQFYWSVLKGVDGFIGQVGGW